jgi:exosome complex RNA-binding protein Rrp42 (RNase PH superfamily)
VSRVPLVATVTRFGNGGIVVDATRDECALGDYALAVAADAEGNVRGVSTMSATKKSVDVSSLRAMTKAARDVARRMHAATDAFLVAAVSRAERFGDEEDEDEDHP